jgi:hypothetical protein
MHKTSFWRKSLGALLLLTLVAPVPAFAITFLGSWRFFESVPGIATKNSADSPNFYTLQIGMGQVPPPDINKLSVTATRDFQITSSSELVRIQHQFRTLLRNSSINVNVSIQQFNVPNDPFNFPPYSFSAVNPGAGTFSVAQLDFAKTGQLMMGLYRATITITYTRNIADSFWNNTSPHTFTFSGL